MTARIPNPATGAHITIEPTPITAGGRPVVLIDGVLHIVHELAKPGLRLVAQTFDVGAKSTRIADRNDDTEAASTTPVSSHNDPEKAGSQ